MSKKVKWQKEQVQSLFEKPFFDLIVEAHKVHKENFPANKVQLSTLLSIKTGACPEDCAYCTQSIRYKTELKNEILMDIDKVLERARLAKENGYSRFCLGAAWRRPPPKDFIKVVEMIIEIKKLGLETCVTLGTLNENQVAMLKEAGLDYYNHNLDTSADYYKKIITTRPYEERLETIKRVRHSGIKVCCGGIMGMGEELTDRINFLLELANMEQSPESVPINKLIKIKGTPLSEAKELDDFEFIRIIAVARIMMPASYVRLSAGRDSMNESTQALCFFAGANSIHGGEKLLTSANPLPSKDKSLFEKLGLEPLIPPTLQCETASCE